MVQALEQDSRRFQPALLQMVQRRTTQRVPTLPGPTLRYVAQEQGRTNLGGRTSRQGRTRTSPQAHLRRPLSRGEQDRARSPRELPDQEGRHDRTLPPDDPGVSDDDAGGSQTGRMLY